MPRLITGIWHIPPVNVNSSGIYIQGQNSALSLLATSIMYFSYRKYVSLLSLLSKLSLHI